MNIVKVFIKGLEDKELSSFKLCYCIDSFFTLWTG